MNQVPCEHRWRIVMLAVLDDDVMQLFERCEKCGARQSKRVTPDTARAVFEAFGFDTTVT